MDTGRASFDRLRAEGLDPSSWGNAPLDRYRAHEHDYDKTIVVVAGSIRFGLPDQGDTIELTEGDRLELPAGTRHDALVGPEGVTCLEAHLAPGTFATAGHRERGTW
jgi:quercetin dioxygenase-like cupin family protein